MQEGREGETDRQGWYVYDVNMLHVVVYSYKGFL